MKPTRARIRGVTWWLPAVAGNELAPDLRSPSQPSENLVV
jgi:hypothetical protein